MFSRKKRELMKTPSLSKKSRAGSPAPQSEAPRKDVIESSTEGLSNPALSSPLPSGTLKRPTSLSRHASAAGIPLSSPRSKVSKPAGAPSPPESGEGPFIEVEDISQLLGDVARFAERLEKLRDVVLTDVSGLKWRTPDGPHYSRCPFVTTKTVVCLFGVQVNGKTICFGFSVDPNVKETDRAEVFQFYRFFFMLISLQNSPCAF